MTFILTRIIQRLKQTKAQLKWRAALQRGPAKRVATLHIHTSQLLLEKHVQDIKQPCDIMPPKILQGCFKSFLRLLLLRLRLCYQMFFLTEMQNDSALIEQDFKQPPR